MHSVCWAKAPHGSATATRRRLLLTARSLHHPDGARMASPELELAHQMCHLLDADHVVDDHYVTLAWDDSKQLGVIVLDDSAHFNALGRALADDLAKLVKYVSTMTHARTFVLQAAGPHFCVGGNPYSKHVDVSVAVLADGLLASARSCCKLRELNCPVTAALHGHLAGGGIALCLNVSYRCV